MPSQWVRSNFLAIPWSNAKQTRIVAAMSAGQTLLRSRVYWGFHGHTTTDVDVYNVATNACTLGLVTTVGNGTESVPDPVTQSGDQSPPTGRWLWWESRLPQCHVWDMTNNMAIWHSSPPQEPPDSKGQVLAQALGVGNHMSVWLSLKSDTAWDPTGGCPIWAAVVLLISI